MTVNVNVLTAKVAAIAWLAWTLIKLTTWPEGSVTATGLPSTVMPTMR